MDKGDEPLYQRLTDIDASTHQEIDGVVKSMRTSFKDQEYFENYILLNKEDIEFYEDGLKSGATANDRIPAVKRQIFTTGLHTVIAKYSAGHSVQEIQNNFKEVINALKEGWQSEGKNIQFDDYILMLWMLSLAVLLDIDDSDFRKIITVLDESRHKDGIYDLIIWSKFSDRNKVSELTYPDEFGFLKTFYETKNTEDLKNYLDNVWYKKMKPTYWFDNDKNKNEVFFGYWSFESAAFVKIADAEDSSLKNQKYYPYDWVHWK
ncbi:PoNe immunity protein domain-containing protein [Chryseobacterium sp. MYb264]|uniref:PoNe immunity protein domain-containing protein n=1 Tax=Chryseobacterium sp. MYb264 TaxID=2745153 RepID=UPI002E103870|nr:PoNe immunity protein domain-containing protein [Chryseobacterium sp. MYb264]